MPCRPWSTSICRPSAATLNQNNKYQPDLEAYEGMYVRIPETLTITEQFQLDRFNEIKLSANGRLETFTNEFEPSVAGLCRPSAADRRPHDHL